MNIRAQREKHRPAPLFSTTKRYTNKMKKFVVMAATVAALFAAPATQAAPDLTSLLKGALSGNKSTNTTTTTTTTTTNDATSTLLSGLQGLLNGVMSTSNLTEADIVGNWKYSAPAVEFQSENLLQQAGGSAMSGVITNKLSPYYKKVGIDKLVATFTSDKTFKFTMNRVTLEGTFAKDTTSDSGDFIFQFTTASGTIPVGQQFTAHITKSGSTLSITFDASKLITLVNTVATVSGKSSLQTVSTLLNSYDGLNCGFQLTAN